MSETARTAQHFDPSRRTFLKGAALCGASIAASVTASASADESAEQKPQTVYPYATYEADVVVVGGGLAGMAAARKAMIEGKTVVLVDKGPFGHSGASGINWGHNFTSYENYPMDDSAMIARMSGVEGLIDQDWCHNLIEASRDLKIFELTAEMGIVAERDNVDGSLNPGGGARVENGFFPRMFAQYLIEKGLKVVDRTMVIDILEASDGSIAGVVAIDLVDGGATVFRGKAVVFATGGSGYTVGWTGHGSKSSTGPEQTGDGTAILMAHGIGVSELEIQGGYFYNRFPNSLGYTQHFGFGAVDHPENFMTADGKRILEDNLVWKEAASNGNFYKIMCKEIYEGRGTQNGALLYDITNVSEPLYNVRYNRRTFENMQLDMGYTPQSPIEMVFCPAESYEVPRLRPNAETAIDGLFVGKYYNFQTVSAGHLAGTSACAYVDATEGFKDINLDAVQEILAGAYSHLERGGEGIRPKDIQHMIQNVMFDYLMMGKTEEGIQTAIAELERIKAEDIPNMVLADKSRRFNAEWRQAIEVPFMWTYAMGAALASSTRTETRWLHHRLDHPNMDNTNWLKNIYVSLSAGEFVVEIEDVKDTYIPVDRIRELVREVGIGDYPQA